MPVIGERPEVTLDHIFLATDFSPSAQKATHYAAALAKQYSSRLTLLNVIDLSVMAASVGTLVGPAIDVLKESAQREMNDAAEQLRDLPLEVQSLEDFSPVRAILDATRNASLLVMGTTSKHGAAKLIVGSVAEGVLRSAACPVLTIGPNVPDFAAGGPLRFSEIVFATDFSVQAAKAAPFALAFAEDSGANLYLCHVMPKEKGESASDQSAVFAALERSVPSSSYDWCNPHSVVEHGKAAEVILTLADNVRANLIVLGARKASFWLDYIHTGLTPALLAEAKCPILTVS